VFINSNLDSLDLVMGVILYTYLPLLYCSLLLKAYRFSFHFYLMAKNLGLVLCCWSLLFWSETLWSFGNSSWKSWQFTSSQIFQMNGKMPTINMHPYFGNQLTRHFHISCYEIWEKAKSVYANDIHHLYDFVHNLASRQMEDHDLIFYIGKARQLFNNCGKF
jgi:hypothetical protein